MKAIFKLKYLIRNTLKMTSKVNIETVKYNTEVAKTTIIDLKKELEILQNEYDNVRAEQLRQENAKLLLAVEDAKRKLVDLEVRNNVKQISIPHRNLTTSNVNTQNEPENEVQTKGKALSVETQESKPKKEKKPKEAKKPESDELPIDIGRLDLRIAKIEDVQKHPDADSLYVLKINCGEDKPRTVCSGLVKYISMDELKDRKVMLLCNLKPVKMRGITSEAMVMCASSPEAIEVLIPPENALPGDLVECEGYRRQPDGIMNPKKKIFETVAPDLHTNDKLEACFKGVPFSVPGKGVVSTKSLKNVAVK